MGNRIIKNILKTTTTLFILLLLSIKFSNSALATDPLTPWTINTSLPFELANFPSTTFLNKLFVFGGSTTFVRSETISSSILSDGSLASWNTSSSAPLPQKLFWHSLIQNGNDVYILGGAIYPDNIVNSVNNVYRGSFDSNGILLNGKRWLLYQKG